LYVTSWRRAVQSVAQEAIKDLERRLVVLQRRLTFGERGNFKHPLDSGDKRSKKYNDKVFKEDLNSGEKQAIKSLMDKIVKIKVELFREYVNIMVDTRKSLAPATYNNIILRVPLHSDSKNKSTSKMPLEKSTYQPPTLNKNLVGEYYMFKMRQEACISQTANGDLTWSDKANQKSKASEGENQSTARSGRNRGYRSGGSEEPLTIHDFAVSFLEFVREKIVTSPFSTMEEVEFVYEKWLPFIEKISTPQLYSFYRSSVVFSIYHGLDCILDKNKQVLDVVRGLHDKILSAESKWRSPSSTSWKGDNNKKEQNISEMLQKYPAGVRHLTRMTMNSSISQNDKWRVYEAVDNKHWLNLLNDNSVHSRAVVQIFEVLLYTNDKRKDQLWNNIKNLQSKMKLEAQQMFPHQNITWCRKSLQDTIQKYEITDFTSSSPVQDHRNWQHDLRKLIMATRLSRSSSEMLETLKFLKGHLEDSCMNQAQGRVVELLFGPLGNITSLVDERTTIDSTDSRTKLTLDVWESKALNNYQGWVAREWKTMVIDEYFKQLVSQSKECRLLLIDILHKGLLLENNEKAGQWFEFSPNTVAESNSLREEETGRGEKYQLAETNQEYAPDTVTNITLTELFLRLSKQVINRAVALNPLTGLGFELFDFGVELQWIIARKFLGLKKLGKEFRIQLDKDVCDRFANRHFRANNNAQDRAVEKNLISAMKQAYDLRNKQLNPSFWETQRNVWIKTLPVVKKHWEDSEVLNTWLAEFTNKLDSDYEAAKKPSSGILVDADGLLAVTEKDTVIQALNELIVTEQFNWRDIFRVSGRRLLDLLDSVVLKTRQGRAFVFMWLAIHEVGGEDVVNGKYSRTSMEAKIRRGECIERLLNSTLSAIHLRPVWTHLARWQQNKLDPILQKMTTNAFRGSYYIPPSKRIEWTKDISVLMTAEPPRRRRGAVAVEKPPLAQFNDYPHAVAYREKHKTTTKVVLNMIYTISNSIKERDMWWKDLQDPSIVNQIRIEAEQDRIFSQNILVKQQEAVKSNADPKNVDDIDQWQYYDVYYQLRLLPRQAKLVLNKRFSEANNEERSVDDRTKSVIRWTLLPNCEFPTIVKAYNQYDKKWPVNVSEAVLRGCMYTFDLLAPLQFLLSPEFLGSDRARIAVYSLAKCINYLPEQQLMKALLYVLSGRRRDVLKVTAYKELLRILGGRPTPKHIDMLSHEWQRKELHRDVKITIIQVAIKLLMTQKDDVNKFCWKILNDTVRGGGASVGKGIGGVGGGGAQIELLAALLGARPADTTSPGKDRTLGRNVPRAAGKKREVGTLDATIVNPVAELIGKIAKTPRLVDAFNALAKHRVPTANCNEFCLKVLLALDPLKVPEDIIYVTFAVLPVWYPHLIQEFSSTSVSSDKSGDPKFNLNKIEIKYKDEGTRTKICKSLYKVVTENMLTDEALISKRPDERKIWASRFDLVWKGLLKITGFTRQLANDNYLKDVVVSASLVYTKWCDDHFRAKSAVNGPPTKAEEEKRAEVTKRINNSLIPDLLDSQLSLPVLDYSAVKASTKKPLPVATSETTSRGAGVRIKLSTTSPSAGYYWLKLLLNQVLHTLKPLAYFPLAFSQFYSLNYVTIGESVPECIRYMSLWTQDTATHYPLYEDSTVSLSISAGASHTHLDHHSFHYSGITKHDLLLKYILYSRYSSFDLVSKFLQNRLLYNHYSINHVVGSGEDFYLLIQAVSTQDHRQPYAPSSAPSTYPSKSEPVKHWEGPTQTNRYTGL